MVHEEKIRLKLVIDPSELEKKTLESQQRVNKRLAEDAKRQRPMPGTPSTRPSRRLENEPAVAEAVNLFRLMGRLASGHSLLSVRSISDIRHLTSIAQRTGSSGLGNIGGAALANSFRFSSFLNQFARQARVVPSPSPDVAKATRPGSPTRPSSPMEETARRSAEAVTRMSGRLVHAVDQTSVQMGHRVWKGALRETIGGIGEPKMERPASPGEVEQAKLGPFAKAAVRANAPQSLLNKIMGATTGYKIPKIPPGLLNAIKGGMRMAGGTVEGTAVEGGAASIAGSTGGAITKIGGALSGLGGPAAIIAAAVVLDVKNFVRAMSEYIGGISGAVKAGATRQDASGIIKGGIKAYGGMVRGAGGGILGPIMGWLFDKFAAVQNKVIDALDNLSNALAKYAPSSARAEALYLAQQSVSRVKTAQAFSPINTAWLEFKTTFLRGFDDLIGLIRPGLNIVGVMLEKLAQGIAAVESGFHRLLVRLHLIDDGKSKTGFKGWIQAMMGAAGGIQGNMARGMVGGPGGQTPNNFLIQGWQGAAGLANLLLGGGGGPPGAGGPPGGNPPGGNPPGGNPPGGNPPGGNPPRGGNPPAAPGAPGNPGNAGGGNAAVSAKYTLGNVFNQDQLNRLTPSSMIRSQALLVKINAMEKLAQTTTLTDRQIRAEKYWQSQLMGMPSTASVNWNNYNPDATSKSGRFFPWGKVGSHSRMPGFSHDESSGPGMPFAIPQMQWKVPGTNDPMPHGAALLAALKDQVAGRPSAYDATGVMATTPIDMHGPVPSIFNTPVRKGSELDRINQNQENPSSRLYSHHETYVPYVRPIPPEVKLAMSIHQKIENERTLHEAMGTIQRIMFQSLHTAKNEGALDTVMLATAATYGAGGMS